MSEKDLYTVLTVDVETGGEVGVYVMVHGTTDKDGLPKLVAFVADAIQYDHEGYSIFDDGEYETVEEAIEAGFVTEDEVTEMRARYKALAAKAVKAAGSASPYSDVRFDHPKDGFTLLVIRPAKVQ